MTAAARSLFYKLLFFSLTLAAASPCWAAEAARVASVQKIWDAAPHSAFTDLIRFNDAFYVAFREASTHIVPPVGQPGGDLRILRSTDGLNWTEAAEFVGGVDRDYRDAKLAVTPDGKLMLEGALATHSAPGTRQSVAWLSDDGVSWSEPVNIGDASYWLWGVHTHDDHIYSIGYGPLNNGPASNWTTRLYRSNGDANFTTFIPTFSPQGGTSEGTLLFREDGSAVALIRRDAGSQLAVVGTSSGDFSKWAWKDANVMFGGPELVEAPDGRIIAGGRRYDGGQRTSLNYLDLKRGTLTEFLTLPSAGDSSYPGMVWHDDKLWVSYYSSHEGKASIYVAQVEFVDESDLPPIRHSGSTSPQSQGWIPQNGGVAVARNSAVTDGGREAWAIDDHLTSGGSREAWTQSLTSSQIADAKQGWRMRASVRVVATNDSPDGAIELSVFPGSDKGYALWLGSDEAGNAIVSEFGGKNSTGLAVRRSATLTGGYHDYELAYDAASNSVELFADGVRILENVVAIDREGAALNRILWGSNASTGRGEANYAFVEFTVGEAQTGDFNQDGQVDGADFLAWQRSLGVVVFPGMGADANRDGVVDAADLNIWKSAIDAEVSAALTVPEPSVSAFVLHIALALPHPLQLALLQAVRL